MVFGFFRKRSDQNIENIHKAVDNSFVRIREDMEKVSSWINHFHSRHDGHDTQLKSHNQKFDEVSRRMSRMEFALAELQAVIMGGEQTSEEFIEEGDGLEEPSSWMDLTETQQKLCWKIAALQKESPNEWITLKTIAQEMYPDKDYSSVRSTICQFVSQLEEMGFIKRRRRGRQTYVCSTEKNPYKDQVKKVAVKSKVKRRKR